MAKKVLSLMARVAAGAAMFAAFISVGTLSCFGMYQPDVPESLRK